jgi:hypothetical protein
MWRRENSWSYRDLNLDPSAVQPVARRYTDDTTPAPYTCFNKLKFDMMPYLEEISAQTVNKEIWAIKFG